MMLTEKVSKYLLLILCISILGACADPTPLPQEKLSYVGLWVAHDRYISIFAHGRLEYKKKLKFGLHTRVQSNFEFEGSKMVTSMFVSFNIDAAPYHENGELKMQIEDVEYIHRGRPVTYGRSNNWPQGVE